jgi:hypothetical protein
MSGHVDPSTYCRRQAAECARKALEATLAEVREAYVNLEQGWLQLAPETSDNQKASTEVGSTRRIAPVAGRTRSRSARPAN